MEGNQKKRGCGWLVVILLLVGVGSAYSGVYACSLSESEALLSLKRNNSYSNVLESWKRGSDCCNGWRGVTCDARTHVVRLQLTDTSLSADLCNLTMLRTLVFNYAVGAIPPCLWNMTELNYVSLEWTSSGMGNLVSPVASPVGMRGLRQLILRNAGISGVLPEWIGNLSQLAYLDVTSNNITALPSLPMSLEYLQAADNDIKEIPSSFGGVGSSLKSIELQINSISNIPADVLSNLSRLESLDLSDNRITAIPPSLACVNLSYLHLEKNWISEVSGSLGQFPKLRSLWLDSNRLTQLPASLGNLSSLKQLSFTDNMITSIPSSIGNLLALEGFHGEGNRMTVIPTSFRNLSNLQYLNLSNNTLLGDIPESLSALTNLYTLNLAKNRLTGQLPGFLYSSTSPLDHLDVSRNQLSGEIQEFRWPALWSLDLSFNNFTGPLPSFALTKFTYLLLSNNKFSGSIPLGLANSSRCLEGLDVSFNQLSGGLPEFLGNCFRLRSLHTASNFLKGQIPSSLGRNESMLVSLSLHNNFFEGEIPESLSNCTKLIVLDLSRNQLNGTLPSSFQNLPPSLRVFMVGSNNLTGEFPSWIVNLTSLQVLDLSNNAFWGELPRSYSKLQGFIIGESTSNSDTLYDDEIQITAKGGQMELSSIISVRTSFDVHNNQFTGSIPEKLSELQGLRYLTLSGNSFNGSIPAGLSNLSHLESLYLFNNLLTGKIPPELSDISSLGYFNVSSNQLTGRIPPGHIQTFNSSSFANNSGLCGIPLPDCSSASVPMQAPTQPPSNDFKDSVGDWVSLNGFLIGFSASFGTVSFVFAFSKKARFFLCVPKRTVKRVYWYRKPYGMYMPKQ